MFNKEQIENIRNILNTIESIENRLASSAKNTETPYKPRMKKEIITKLEQFSKIQESLEKKQQIQEQIQKDLSQYQEQQQLQQQKW